MASRIEVDIHTVEGAVDNTKIPATLPVRASPFSPGIGVVSARKTL
jgi:hypothetical protein